MLGMTPAMLAMLALQNPDMVARLASAKGAPPPPIPQSAGAAQAGQTAPVQPAMPTLAVPPQPQFKMDMGSRQPEMGTMRAEAQMPQPQQPQVAAPAPAPVQPQPGLAPLTMQLMAQQPAAQASPVMPVGPRGTLSQQQDAANMATAQAAGNVAPGVPATPGPDWAAGLQALGQIRPPVDPNAAAGRVGFAPAPFQGGALSPQMVEFMKLMMSGANQAPSIGQVM